MDEIKCAIQEYDEQLSDVLSEIDDTVSFFNADEHFVILTEDDNYCSTNEIGDVLRLIESPDSLNSVLNKMARDDDMGREDIDISYVASQFSGLLEKYMHIAIVACAMSHAISKFHYSNCDLVSSYKARDSYAPESDNWIGLSAIFRGEIYNNFCNALPVIADLVESIASRSVINCDFYSGCSASGFSCEPKKAFEIFESSHDDVAIFLLGNNE